MRRSASAIIRNLEGRIARLEKSAGSNTPIKMTYPSNPGSPRSRELSHTVNGLGEMLQEVRELFDETTSIVDPRDPSKTIESNWTSTYMNDMGDTIIFGVDHEQDQGGHGYFEVSKSDICRAMCEQGLCDNLIESFLKSKLNLR